MHAHAEMQGWISDIYYSQQIQLPNDQFDNWTLEVCLTWLTEEVNYFVAQVQQDGGERGCR